MWGSGLGAKTMQPPTPITPSVLSSSFITPLDIYHKRYKIDIGTAARLIGSKQLMPVLLDGVILMTLNDFE